MAKIPYQDPLSNEVQSPLLAGTIEGLSKVSETVGMDTEVITDSPLAPIPGLDESDPYRIYQCLDGNRIWLSSPAPVIKLNGSVMSISQYKYSIDYIGGSITFIGDYRPGPSDVITASFSKIVVGSTITERVDNIISSGTPTEGNTELIDIRTAYKGDVYATAGEAVRKQIEKVSNGIETLNLGGLNLKEDFIGEQINEWLDSHPEATTTVQDGSIEEIKLSESLKNKAIKDYVTPEMYGAVGDGISDDTNYIVKAIESGKDIKIVKSYKCGDIKFDNNVFGNGTLIANQISFSGNKKIVSNVFIEGSVLIESSFSNFYNLKVSKGTTTISGERNTLSNCLFDNIEGDGIYISPSGVDTTITSTIVRQCTGNGIKLYTSGTFIDSCHIYRCFEWGLLVSAGGAIISDTKVYCNGGNVDTGEPTTGKGGIFLNGTLESNCINITLDGVDVQQNIGVGLKAQHTITSKFNLCVDANSWFENGANYGVEISKECVGCFGNIIYTSGIKGLCRDKGILVEVPTINVISNSYPQRTAFSDYFLTPPIISVEKNNNILKTTKSNCKITIPSQTDFSEIPLAEIDTIGVSSSVYTICQYENEIESYNGIFAVSNNNSEGIINTYKIQLLVKRNSSTTFIDNPLLTPSDNRYYICSGKSFVSIPFDFSSLVENDEEITAIRILCYHNKSSEDLQGTVKFETKCKVVF